MNGFFWARRYMFRHKRRTFLTAFGVALAIALVCGTGLLFDSFRTMMINVQILSSGNWHYEIDGGMTREQADTLAANYAFEAGSVYSYDTYAEFDSTYKKRDDTTNELVDVSKPQYLRILEGDSGFVDMSNILSNFVAGRLPENSDEIAISTNARNTFASVPSLGDTLTLSVGELNISIETAEDRRTEICDFTPTGTRTFTIVGFYEGVYTSNDSTYHAFSVPDGGVHSWDVRVRLKNTSDYEQTVLAALEQAGISAASVDIKDNSALLRYYAQGLDDTAQQALLGTCGLLIAIILAMMMLVVRNTFAISVDEKMQQFGILRCLGAGRRRIYSIVTCEAMLMWLIAAPVGVAGALVAMQIVFSVLHSFDSQLLKYLELHWTAWPFVLALGTSLACVVLAAMAPARKCAKVSPVGAVRGEGSLRSDKMKKARGGKLLGSMLGFPGLMSTRNMRRNPRKYRATLISVACSIALFLVMNGFATGYRTSLHRYTGMDGMDIRISGTPETADAVRGKLAELDSVSRISGYPYYGAITDVSPEKYGAEYIEFFNEYNGDDPHGTESVKVEYIDRDEFGALTFEGKAPSYEEFLQPGNAILFQKSILASSRTGVKVLPVSTFANGETLACRPQTDAASTEYKICGQLATLPWYNEFNGCLVMFIAEENMPAAVDGDDYNYTFALLAKDGTQKQLSKDMAALAYTREFIGWSVTDVYAQTLENRSLLQVMDLFLYGFTAVILLICCMNLLNTVKTNMNSRRREMAMLRAIGMSRSQMMRMLSLECVWYAILGTLLGLAIGLPLEWLLFRAVSGMLTIDFASMLMMWQIPVCMVATCAIALAAGFGPIREILRRPATEGIRAIE